MNVYVVSYNAGVLGVYKTRMKANVEASDYKLVGFKGVKVQEFSI